MKKLTFLLLLLGLAVQAQSHAPVAEPYEVNKYVKGTLLLPSVEKPPLVVFIQGSGPTDRDGNQPFMRNNSLKKLAAALAEKGIASYRFDKRILRPELHIQEGDVRFEDFVEDAASAVAHLAEKDRFGKTLILGHSQGSLVAMLAAREHADGLISIAGPAQPIDSIIIEQISSQMPALKENLQQSFQELREKGSTKSYHPLLKGIFRPSVQPFMLSWMRYNPEKIISNLDLPVLIINGSNDLQVGTQEAKKLKEANPEAKMLLLENMNHVLRQIDGGSLENSKSYNEPELPLHPELVPAIVKFINNL